MVCTLAVFDGVIGQVLVRFLLTHEDGRSRASRYYWFSGRSAVLYANDPFPFPCSTISSITRLTCGAMALLNVPRILVHVLRQILSFFGSCASVGNGHNGPMCLCAPHLKHSPEQICAIPGVSRKGVLSVHLAPSPHLPAH